MNRELISEAPMTILGIVLLIIAAPRVPAQQSAPRAYDQTLTTGQFAGTHTAAECTLPPGFDQKPLIFDQNIVVAFKQKAGSGDAAAQCGLGFLYLNGWGVVQDNTQAVTWWRKAAEQGSASAQYLLGLMYATGRGVIKQDDTQAATWWRRAAEQGNALAQENLGGLYNNGEGVPQDYAQAAVWWLKAANQGDAEAQLAIGRLYHTGRGVPQDDTQASLWLRKAAEQGIAMAQFFVGDLYYEGHGVPQDWAEAYFWLNLAAAGKLEGALAESAATVRNDAALHMMPADLAREQERARRWFETHKSKPQ